MSDPAQAPVPPSGQGPAPVQPPKGTEANVSGWTPVEYQWEDGEKQSFNTKEDLLRYVREGTLRHRDYTKKTQELAKQREAHTKREKEIEAMASELMEKKSRIDPMDKFLTERKDIADYIAKQMRQPSSEAQDEKFKRLIEEYTKPLQDKLTEAEKWKKDQESAKRKEELYGALGKQYQDFDRPTVEQMLQQLQETPEGDEDRALIELAHWAAKGRKGTVAPLAVEEKAAELARKKVGKMSPVPSAHASPVPASSETPKSIKDAVNQYKERHSA